MEKFIEVKPTFVNGKYDCISSIGKINNETIVLNGNKEVKMNDHYFYRECENGEFKSIFGKSLERINNNTYISKKHKKYQYHSSEIYESNLDPIKRWLIDNVNVPMKKVSLNKFYWDIENDFSLDVENAPKPITAITCFSNKIMKYILFAWRYDFEDDLKIENYEANEFVINSETNERLDLPLTMYIFNDEREMMKKFIEFSRDMKPHLYMGWNADYFDNTYTYNRCLKHLNLGKEFKQHFGILGCNRVYNKKFDKYDFKINSSFSLDMLQGYKHMTLGELNSYSLKSCSKDILGDNKNEIELKDAWRKDFRALLRYNVKDVKLLVDIDDKIGIADFFDNKRRTLGCDWDSLFQNSKSIDYWFLRKSRQNNIVLPDPNYIAYNQNKSFKGAYVIKPIAGMYYWVIALDLKSLYPSLIQQFNLSPETKDGLGEIQLSKLGIPSYVRQDDKLGFIPQTIDELQTIRKEMKNKMYQYEEGSDEYNMYNANQNVQKFLINSIYGVLGYSGFRLYDLEVAESVTTMGQETIKHTENIIKENGYRVVAGDTDSCYVQVFGKNLDDVIKIGENLRDKINFSYTKLVQSFGCEKNTHLEIEFEQVNKQLFIAGNSNGVGMKKRYAYKSVWKDGFKHEKIGFKGFEVIRSNASGVSKKVQSKLFEVLFDDNVEFKKEKYEEWLRQFKKNLKNLKYKYSYIGIPQTLKKNTEDYKVTNPFVRASEYSNKHLDTSYGIDTKLKIIYIKSIVGIPDTDSLVFEDEDKFLQTLKEKNITFVIDWKYMFDKIIEDKIKNIYIVLKWSKMGQETINKWLN